MKLIASAKPNDNFVSVRWNYDKRIDQKEFLFEFNIRKETFLDFTDMGKALREYTGYKIKKKTVTNLTARNFMRVIAKIALYNVKHYNSPKT